MDGKIVTAKKMGVAVIVLTMFLSFLTLSGCGIERRPAPTPTQPAPGTNMPGNNPMETPQQSDQNMTQKSQLIAQKVSQLEGINSATVVLAEKNAWVGVDMAAETNPPLTNELKDRITGVVKAEDNSVETVFVSADADTVTRLRNIGKDIGAGKPIAGFMNELFEIGRRITPSAR